MWLFSCCTFADIFATAVTSLDDPSSKMWRHAMDQESHSLQRWQNRWGDELVRQYRKPKPTILPGYMTTTPLGLESTGTYNGKCDRYEGELGPGAGVWTEEQSRRYQPQGYKHLRHSVARVKNSPYDTPQLQQESLEASANSKAEYNLNKGGLLSSMGGENPNPNPKHKSTAL